jgi:hypothetical protein
MNFDDPVFWRAGAISTVVVMSFVLIMLTIDSLAAISPGGSNVPLYTVIKFSWLDGVESDELEAPSQSACARVVFSKE